MSVVFALLFISSPPGGLMDYYNGTIKPDDHSAREIVNASLENPADSYQMAVAMFLSGYLNKKEGNILKATMDYTGCIGLLGKLDTTDLYLEISVRKNLGSILDNLGEYEKAIYYYQAALPFAEKYGKKELASLYTNMGNSYRDMKNAEMLMDCYTKSIELAKEAGDFVRIAQVNTKLGLSFYDAKAYDTAEYYFFQAIYQRPYIPEQSLKVIGQAYHNLASLYIQKGDTGQALRNYLTAVEYKEGQDKYNSLMDIGEIYLNTGDLKKSEKYLREALALYPGESAQNAQSHSIYKFLASLSLKQGDQFGALRYQSKYSEALLTYTQNKEKIADLAAKSYNRELFLAYERDKTARHTGETMEAALSVALILLVFGGGLASYYFLRTKKHSESIRGLERDLTHVLKS